MFYEGWLVPDPRLPSIMRYSEYKPAPIEGVYDPPAEFTELAGFAPLGRQFGVAAPLTVPTELHPVLFPDQQPVMAVIDMAKLGQGASVLDGHDGAARSLFVGAAENRFADTAPYLVELDANADLTRLLLTQDRGLSPEMTTQHAYHLEAAIFLHPAADFDALWGHLRRFTRVTDARGKWYYFRFWEPRYLLSMSHRPLAGTSPARRLLDPRMIRAAFGLAGRRGISVEPRHIPAALPIRLTSDDLAMMQLWRREQFFDKVEHALTEEYVVDAPDQLRDEIRAHYDVARQRGYRIEAASYFFIRACYVLARMGMSIDQFENQVDPRRILSPLNRAKSVWASVERVSIYD